MRKMDAEIPEPTFNKRDVRIFKDVYERGALTPRQISALHYPPHLFPVGQTHSNCQRRLRQYTLHGYFERRERPEYPGRGRKENVHLLTTKGLKKLAYWLGCDVADLAYPERKKYLSEDFLDHFVAVNDFWVALNLVSAQINASLEQWYDQLYFKRNPLIIPPTESKESGTTKAEKLEPDGYFHLRTRAGEEYHDYHRFVEIDRGTQTGKSSDESYNTWERKVRLYLAYFNSGEYTKRFETKGFAVLLVTTGEKRMYNLKRVTEKFKGSTLRFWFTTFEQITSEKLLTQPIWQAARKNELFTIVY